MNICFCNAFWQSTLLQVGLANGQYNFHYSLDIWNYEIKQQQLLTQLVIWDTNIVQCKFNPQLVIDTQVEFNRIKQKT